MLVKILLFSSSIIIIFTFNLDTDYVMFREYNNVSDVDDSYFGFSVLLYQNATTNVSWLFVGAPQGNYENASSFENIVYPHKHGIVLKCEIRGSCEYVRPHIISNEKSRIRTDFFKKTSYMNAIIQKENGWFGSSMAINKVNNFLTICAPRTILSISASLGSERFNSMHGMCYFGPITSGLVFIQNADAKGYDFQKPFWYNPLRGFSIHYSPIRQKQAIAGIIGEPNRELYGTVSILDGFEEKSIVLPADDELSEFGYSVTSGFFFNKDELLYASGAPGWQYVGLVAIINPQLNSSIIAKLQGTAVGEFFGATITTGDLNNDGFSDLVVGAPHWGQDNGKVYTYFGSPKGVLEAALTIEGYVEGGLFGYSITCGDLDKDGFSDIIIGAPWEASGVIYVYNGDSYFKDTKNVQPSQRISAEHVYKKIGSLKRNIKRFGFSISEPINMNGNGYPYVAVGAYKSAQCFIFQSKPVIRTNLTVSTTPDILQRNISNFIINTCVRHHNNHMQYAQTFLITIMIDETLKRTKQSLLRYISFTEFGMQSCTSTNITMLDNIQNFIEPITILVKHEFVRNVTLNNTFCETCPVENKGSLFRSIQVNLPFDIDCGEDKICNSNVSVTAKFYGVQGNNAWVIGSNDISLEAITENHGEPAYFSSIVFTLPQGVVLRSILPSCQEVLDTDLRIICEIGNPLGNEEQKVIKLDLDMRYFTHTLDFEHILNFTANIKTYSINSGNAVVSLKLHLNSEAALSLDGKANDESYYFPILSNQKLYISFQHTYQIIKLGASPIFDAQLTINVPTQFKDLDLLVYLYKPQLYISGKIVDCSSQYINVLEMPISDIQNKSHMEQFNSDQYGFKQESLSKVIDTNNTINKLEMGYIHTDYKQHSMTTQTILTISNKQGNSSIMRIATNVDMHRMITSLNCSTHNVQCSPITCDLSALKTSQDVGKIVIKLILDASKLEGIFLKENIIIKYSSEAHVEIMQPRVNLSTMKTRSRLQLTTMFYGSVKADKVQLWVILVSVSLGLILLCIFILILSMVGFFKRSQREKLTELKTFKTQVNEHAEAEMTNGSISDKA